MTLYSADSFNRADSTTNLGSTDGAGTLDPIAWTQQAGTWGIETNRAYTSAGAARSVATVELSQADVDLSITVAFGSSGTGGLVFRFVDTSNYWRLVLVSTTLIRLIKRTSGSDNVVGTFGTAASGDVLRILAAGSSITAYRNGSSIITTTDTDLQTATKHGLVLDNTTNQRLDLWSATSGPVTTAQAVDVTQTQTPTLTTAQTLGVSPSVTETQTPTLALLAVYGATLSVTQVQTPTIVRVLSATHELTVTQVQTPTLAAGISIHHLTLTVTQHHTPSLGKVFILENLDPPPGEAPVVTIRVVDLDGNPHTSSGLTNGQLPLARCVSITRAINQPKQAVVAFPKYAYDRDDVHLFAADSGTGALHLIEVVRSGVVRFRGVAVVAESDSGNGEVTLHCRGLDWILGRRFLDGQRTNELTNPSFETGDETGWADSGAVTSTVTTDDSIRGAYSLRLESLSALGDIFKEQTVSVTGTGVGTFITVVFYFKLELIVGHALDRRGLYVEARESGVLQTNDYYPIDEATPAGEWIRAKVGIAVPPVTTWDINVRLYSPPGSILWDDGQMVAMQSVSTASITGDTTTPVDVSRIVGLILAHVQNPAVGKSDLNLGLVNPTVGVRQVKHIQWADHISWQDQMSEWLDRDDCFDYSIRNNLDGTNQLVLHVPQSGTDRRATVTLAFPGNITSFDYAEDGGGTVTDDVELDDDSGDGPDREEGHYADASLIGGLTLQAVNAAPTKSEPSSLDPLAREQVTKARRPAQLLTVTLRGAALMTGRAFDEMLQLGDTVTLDAADGWITVNGVGRISEMTEYPRDRRLEVTIPVAIP